MWTGHASATLVALAAFQPCRNIDFVDFDGTDEIERRRVERLREALDALVDRFVLDVDI